MSKREWEKGTINLPSAAWAPFKQALQKGMSVHIANDFELANKLHAVLLEQKKGKRGFDLGAAFDAEAYARLPGAQSFYRSDDGRMKYPFVVIEPYQVKRFLLGDEKPYSLLKPKKKDFAPFNSTSLQFEGPECTLSLNNATREVTWDVAENNHNVEQARKSTLGRLLFELLKKVKWTRNTGGTFVGNDENNEDSEYEGGGSNYVTARFGPLGEPSYLHLLQPKRPKKSASTPRR